MSTKNFIPDGQVRLDLSTQSNTVFVNLLVPAGSGTIRFPRPLKDILSIQVQSVEIPFSWHSIRPGCNLIGINGVDFTIPSGNYSGSELCKELDNLLVVANAGQPITCVYKATTNHFTLTTAGAAFTLNTNTGVDTITGKMGFDTSADLSGDTVYESTLAVNLTGDNSIYIKSNNLTAGNFFGSNYENRLAGFDALQGDTFIKVPLSVNPNFLITERPMDAVIGYEKITHKRLDAIDLKLVFPSNEEEIDLLGQSWSISLMVTLDVEN